MTEGNSPRTTYIINGTTGAIVTTINFVGGVDQGWYNPGDGNYYEAARDMLPSPVLGVIDAKRRQWLQNVPTNGNAHSVAADLNQQSRLRASARRRAIASRKLPMVA